MHDFLYQNVSILPSCILLPSLFSDNIADGAHDPGAFCLNLVQLNMGIIDLDNNSNIPLFKEVNKNKKRNLFSTLV